MVIANWFGNAVGLLRMGDAYRAYLFSHASGSTISQSVGILVAERVADVTAICILLLVATAGVLATARGDQPLARSLPLAGLLLFVLAIGVVVAMARFGVPSRGGSPAPSESGTCSSTDRPWRASTAPPLPPPSAPSRGCWRPCGSSSSSRHWG